MTDIKKKAPDEGPHGVDRWTSNGYGITINGKKVKPPNDDKNDKADAGMIDEIEED